MITLVDLVSGKICQTKWAFVSGGRLEGLGWLCGVRQWVEETELLKTCLYPSSFALRNIVGVTECENIVWMCLLISDVCKTSHSTSPKPTLQHFNKRTLSCFASHIFGSWKDDVNTIHFFGVRQCRCNAIRIRRTPSMWHSISCTSRQTYHHHHHHHHHVPEGLGILACSSILKMKLVPPSLPRSSYVSSSFWFIL